MSRLKKQRHTALGMSLGLIALFAALMLFGLKQNPDFHPSVLFGQQAPAFDAPTNQGSRFQFPGPPPAQTSWTVMNFWSTSCSVCRREARHWEHLASTASPRLRLVSVNLQNTPEDVRQWQQDFQQTFPVVLDQTGSISVDYGVMGTPETFLIDERNIIRYRVTGLLPTQVLLGFLTWLEEHPQATEAAASQALGDLYSKVLE